MKFQRIPSIIEAVRFAGIGAGGEMNIDATTFGPGDTPAGPQWLIDAYVNGVLTVGFNGGQEGDNRALWCTTNNGPVVVDAGDWILRGPEGELYPSKPEVFGLLYRPADIDGDGFHLDDRPTR